MVMDVCGAPALTPRVVAERVARRRPPTVAVLGGAGKSGSLSLAAARRAGRHQDRGVVPVETEARALREAGLADAVAVADASDPVALRGGGVRRAGRPGGRDGGVRRRARAASMAPCWPRPTAGR